jgi:RNA polymerase sigma-70 factor (ECF subfamily)
MAKLEGRRPRSVPAAGAGTSNAAGDLLVRFRDGDPAAFQQIVGTYQARLVQFFFRLCWDRDRAEDFAQELFMKLLRGAGRYRPEGKLSTFIFRVATNLWIDQYRSTRPQPRLYSLDQAIHDGERPGYVGAAPKSGPVEQAIEDEERARLRGALEALTEPHRLVFELAVYQEMPYAEIGQVLSIPVGTVKSRMHNSVKALKALLAEARSRGADAPGGDAAPAAGAARARPGGGRVEGAAG